MKERSSPLGATLSPGGANLASTRSTQPESSYSSLTTPMLNLREVIRINSLTNRTYHYWHVFVPGVESRATLRISS